MGCQGWGRPRKSLCSHFRVTFISAGVSGVLGGAALSRSYARPYLVNLFLTKLERISGFSSLFLTNRSVLEHICQRVLKNTAIAEKREENMEILTNLVKGKVNQKNPRAHKNKIGTPPPQSPKYPPPPKRGILWTWVFPAERAHFSRRPSN